MFLFIRIVRKDKTKHLWLTLNIVCHFQEAISCLTDHTNKIKLENRQLRHELLELIRKTRALQDHKRELEEQRRQLTREQQYSEDLKKLRTTRQHKVFQSFGLIGDGDNTEGIEGNPPPMPVA